MCNANTPKFTMIGLHGVMEYTITPGSTIKDSILLKNFDPEKKITLSVKSTFPEKWIRFSKTIATIEANSEELIDITITFPETMPEQMFEEQTKYLIIASLTDWEGKESNGGITFSLEIGKNYFIKTIQGEPFFLDYRTKIPTQELENIKEKSKEIGNLISTFTQKYKIIISIALLLLIIIKLTLIKIKKNKDKTIKTNKVEIKKKINKKKKTTKTNKDKINKKDKTVKTNK